MMLSTLIFKELRATLLSPKFPAYFAICSLLILMSVFIGIREYLASVKEYESGRLLTDQMMHEQSNWSSVPNKAFREPDPMQIFVSGVTFDLGRWGLIEANSATQLRNSVYSEDPIFAVFRFMDFSVIVLVVLSLLALVFTYDAIVGERESGTLRLVFSNAIPRANYLISKCTGAWLGLIVPLLIPILISLLMIQLFGIPFTGNDWLRVGSLIGMSLLFITFFVAFGVFMSTVTKRSSTSFLISLMAWVLFIFIIPRVGILTASQIISVPSIAEIEGQREAFSKDQWENYTKQISTIWQRNQDAAPDTHDTLSDDMVWAHMKIEDSLRKATDQSIQDYEAKLLADKRRAELSQQRLAFALCRFSPASAFQLAGMSLANTDISLKERYEQEMNQFRDEFTSYIEKKNMDAPGSTRLAIMIDSEKGFNVSVPRGNEELDLSDMPRFRPPVWSSGNALTQVAIDAGLLLCLIFAAFSASWVAFMRYDLR